jgi:UDP:flavonoid glycosyltransferase YjiC (YdhE family)
LTFRGFSQKHPASNHVGGGTDFTEQGSRAFTVARFSIYRSANNCGTTDKERPVSKIRVYTTLAMKVAFVAPPISGHLNPMTTLARELQSRNHDVVIISLPDGEPSVRAAGLTFLPCAAKEFPAGSLKERFRQRSKLKGEEALRAILQSAVGRTEAMLNSLPATLTAAAVDAVVLDTVLFYTELVPMSLSMPFDFESSHWPPQFHHTGPFHDGAGRVDVDFPWERLTGEPLIYASMGTLQNGLENVFRAIAEAAAPHRNVQLVLSIGSHLDLDQIGPLPSNAVVVRHAPQLELLKRASVCITHAGLNTVLEALAHGVPQVAIPITVDQPGVAARIAEKKTGLVVSLKELTPSRLSLLLDQVLNDSTYRDSARYFQKVIAETNGLSKAANLLERAFGFGNQGQPLLAQ